MFLFPQWTSLRPTTINSLEEAERSSAGVLAIVYAICESCIYQITKDTTRVAPLKIITPRMALPYVRRPEEKVCFVLSAGKLAHSTEIMNATDSL